MSLVVFSSSVRMFVMYFVVEQFIFRPTFLDSSFNWVNIISNCPKFGTINTMSSANLRWFSFCPFMFTPNSDHSSFVKIDSATVKSFGEIKHIECIIIKQERSTWRYGSSTFYHFPYVPESWQKVDNLDLVSFSFQNKWKNVLLLGMKFLKPFGSEWIKKIRLSIVNWLHTIKSFDLWKKFNLFYSISFLC